jgi:uroporphyrinogen-III synthase
MLSEFDYDWLILTSVNGVHAMWERRRNPSTKHFKHLQIAAIGPATRRPFRWAG